MSATATQVDYFRVQLYPSTADSPLTMTKLLIPLQDIAEMITIQRQDICPLPGVAAGVLGVTNQRGQLIWLLDLCLMGGTVMSDARRLNPQEKLTLILLQNPQGQLGCLVSQLQGIFPVELSAVQGIEAQWQRFYPFCDRQLLQGQETALLLNSAQLFQYLQPT